MSQPAKPDTLDRIKILKLTEVNYDKFASKYSKLMHVKKYDFEVCYIMVSEHNYSTRSKSTQHLH